MAQSKCAIQIIEHISERRFKLKKPIVEAIYGDKRVAKLPLVILCIAGAARKGKSFLLNFFLDFLIHAESHPGEPWELNEDTELAGFEFQAGMDRTTLGIWAWNHVFVIEQSDGTKIAVSLIDSQGTFDNSTTFEDCSTIFAMTCLFSSVMCFNVFNDLQEDKLNNLAAFIDHGQKINDNLGGSGKLFQDLVFIVRDCQYREFFTDKNGGRKYIETVLGPCDVPKLQEVRDSLNSSYERKHCFVFPHPGEKVAYEKTSKVAEMNPTFVENAARAVHTLLSQLTLRKKKIGLTVIQCKDMPGYMTSCIQTFDDNKEFAPQAVQAVNRDFMLNLEEQRAIIEYEKLMNETFEEHKTGCPEDYLKKIDEITAAKIEADISKRIRNEEICSNVLKKFNEARKRVFQTFVKQNKLLLEKEADRLRHEEELQHQQAEYNEKLEREKKERKEELQKVQIQADQKINKAETEFHKKLDNVKEESKKELESQKKENEAKIAATEAKYEVKLESEKQQLQHQMDRQKLENDAKLQNEQVERKRLRDQMERDKKEAEAKNQESQEKFQAKLNEQQRHNDAKLEKEKQDLAAKFKQEGKEREKELLQRQQKLQDTLEQFKKDQEEKEKQRAKKEKEDLEARLKKEKEEREKTEKRQKEINDRLVKDQQERSAQNVKLECQRFKTDVEKRIQRETHGYNTAKTFVSTLHDYHCCIFYNQGVSTTDITLFYRKDGDTIYSLSEDYFFAFRGHRLEGMLKEMLKHSNDVQATWKEAVSQC